MALLHNLSTGKTRVAVQELEGKAVIKECGPQAVRLQDDRIWRRYARE